jgi:spore coat protein U-like protein
MSGSGGAAGQNLGYLLFQDNARTLNWGNTPGTDTPAAVNGNGSAQTMAVYGQIPANQFVTPGSYADTITATVNY